MADSSKIIIGLPNLPDENMDKKMWGEFLTVYRAIQNLLSGVSVNTGIDAPDDLERSSMDPTKYLLGANSQQWYPTANVAISRGQLVTTSNGGLPANFVNIAVATAGGTQAIGIADETKGAGQNIRIITGGLTTAISGMVPGTLYYLSTTPGAVQNLRPVVPGQIVQPVGWAITSNQMLLNVSSYYQQL
jgi:hypothetical protein